MSPARTRTASTSSPRQLRPPRPDPSLNRRSSFPHLPGVGHAGLAYDLIIEIQDECAVSGDVQQEAGDVFRIQDRKSTRLNSSHLVISYAVFCLKKKNTNTSTTG